MKTTLENGTYTIEAENGESLRNIAAAVIISSYNDAFPVGMGFLRATHTELTKEKALAMLDGEDVSKDYNINGNKPNEVYMDYVFGRCCKTSVNLHDGTDGSTPRVSGYISVRDRSPKVILLKAARLLVDWGTV